MDTFTVVLTEEEFVIMCGLLAPSGDVNPDGIFVKAEVWTSLRSKFPASNFYVAVDAGTIDYDEKAGE